MKIDYKVAKTEDCALINAYNWISTSDIILQNIKGKISASYVTEILEENFKEDYGIHKGDYILITKVASEIAPMRSFTLQDNYKYFNLPISQILGKFCNNEVSLRTLELARGKVLVEKIDRKDLLLTLPETSDMLGKVVKVNSSISSVKVGSIVFLKDNIVTPIRLDGKEYYAADDISIVGVFNNGLSVEDIDFINNSILMTPYHGKYLFGSSILLSPDINYEDLDYSDLHNRDLFQIKFLDKSIKELKEGDIVLTRRDFTNYVYLNDEKYFMLNGKKWIEAKIEE